MTQSAALLEAHPRPGPVDRKLLAACIDACVSCAQSCTACADADLAEDDVAAMRRCARLCLDCADVCGATGRVITRQTEWDAPTSRAQVQSCEAICRACAEECEHHAEHHAHCRICGEDCRACELACQALLEAMSIDG
jgi:hypothetical protein